ncbi:MAG: MarR family winged helix-turn-helix transcriptional regulator [Phycisphaerae bacterium]
MQAFPASSSCDIDAPGRAFTAAVDAEQLAGVYLAVIPQLMGFVRRNLNQDPQIDLRMGQFRMMHVLYQNLADSISEAAGVLGVTLSSASKMVDDLEYLGLVTRRPDERDRRRTIVSLTDQGSAIYQQAVNSIREQIATKFQLLTATERGVLFCAALKLAELFQTPLAPPTQPSHPDNINLVAEHA